MGGETHFADDETLAYIEELRVVLGECQRILSLIARPENWHTPSATTLWAQAIEAETKARHILQ